MKVLLVGAGGVGEAITSIATKNDPDAEWLEGIIVCDYDLGRFYQNKIVYVAI